MENVAYEDRILIRLYMEVVAWATWFGLVFPIIFLFSNQNKIPQASKLGIFACALIALTTLLYMVSTGSIFPQIPPEWIRKILYGWGLFLLILATYLIFCTGGIQSSIFTWQLEYALIVVLIVRPKHEQTFFRKWRPVLLIGGSEILIVATLVFLGGCSIRIPNTMDKSIPIWGGGSIVSSLIATFFLFWISTKIKVKEV